MTAHLLGFTDVDDRGQEGIELAYQDWLAGQARQPQGDQGPARAGGGGRAERARAGRRPRPRAVDRSQAAVPRLPRAEGRGHPARAKAGGIVVIDVRTGEVLAMANVPAYNPNNRTVLDVRRARNRAVTDLFEPGSTLKPFTVAAALEARVVRPETLVQTAPGYLVVGNATIHDAHPEGVLSVSQVIQKSSNVGAAKLALAMPREQLWSVLSAAGFGSAPRTGFPGEVAGRLRGYSAGGRSSRPPCRTAMASR